MEETPEDYIRTSALIEGFNTDMLDRTATIALSMSELALTLALIQRGAERGVNPMMAPLVESLYMKLAEAQAALIQPGDTPSHTWGG